MPSTYTTRTRLEKQAPGENNNTWGALLNANTIDMVDQAVAGMASYTLSGSKTLTSNNGASDEARCKYQNITGGTGGTVTVPNVEMVYVVRNGTSGTVTFSTASPTATAPVGAGAFAIVVVEGGNVCRNLLHPTQIVTNVGISAMAFLQTGGTGSFRVESVASTAPLLGGAGVGVEIGISGGAGGISAYNRTTAALAPMSLGASAVAVNAPVTITPPGSGIVTALSLNSGIGQGIAAKIDTTNGAVAFESNGNVAYTDFKSLYAPVGEIRFFPGALTTAALGLTKTYIQFGYTSAKSDYSWLQTGGSNGFWLTNAAGVNIALLTTTSILFGSATTASAANLYQSASMADVLRSTSALKYKREVAEISPLVAHKLREVQPIQFKSRSEADDPDAIFYGFIAEDVAAAGLDPLVHYAYQEDQVEIGPKGLPVPKEGETKRADGVQYERVVVLQQLLINELLDRITAVEAKLV